MCCLIIALPAFTCQQGNKYYGHYQKKQARQTFRLGHEQSWRKNQSLWECAQAKRKISVQDSFQQNFCTTHLSNIPLKQETQVMHDGQEVHSQYHYVSQVPKRTLPVLCALLLCVSLTYAQKVYMQETEELTCSTLDGDSTCILFNNQETEAQATGVQGAIASQFEQFESRYNNCQTNNCKLKLLEKPLQYICVNQGVFATLFDEISRSYRKPMSYRLLDLLHKLVMKGVPRNEQDVSQEEINYILDRTQAAYKCLLPDWLKGNYGLGSQLTYWTCLRQVNPSFFGHADIKLLIQEEIKTRKHYELIIVRGLKMRLLTQPGTPEREIVDQIIVQAHREQMKVEPEIYVPDVYMINGGVFEIDQDEVRDLEDI